MADAKLSALTEISVPDFTDVLYTVDDTGPTSNKLTVSRALGNWLPSTCQGRLTTESGVPVSTADRTAQGTLYFTPFNGNRVALYDGTRWKMYAFAEVSLALTLTNAKAYDVYLYDNAGTLTLELSAAWTNDTTRADATALQDGILVKSGATTRRLVGTIYASGTNTTEDSYAKRYVGNLYNKVRRALYRMDATVTWTYTTAAWQQANANAANQVDFVTPDVTEADVTINVRASNTGATRFEIGIGLDGTSVTATTAANGIAFSAVNNAQFPLIAHWRGMVAAGRHRLTWLEQSTASGTTTWVGDGGETNRSAMLGSVLL